MIRVRFAPSPTGRLHLGNARTALLNALFARHHDGELILRIDDTDQARCRSEYIDAIQEDLRWLGISWDAMYQQSQRDTLYTEYFNQLRHEGRIYPCFETNAQLESQRAIQLAKNLPPIYDRAQGQSIPPHDNPYWRFALNGMPVQWQDAIQGPMSYDVRHVSDPVVMRQDGSMSYLLSSVIDDVSMGITHIIRGADHITNAAIQIQMIQALHKVVPVFAHFPLMFDEAGEKYSKRSGATAIDQLRQEGWFSVAIIQSLAQLGLSRKVTGSFSAMAASFSLDAYGKSNAKFSIQDIKNAQMRLFSSMDYKDLPLAEQEIIPKELWLVIRENILFLSDIAPWHTRCTDAQWRPAKEIDDPSMDRILPKALGHLVDSGALIPDNSGGWAWAPEAWHLWIHALAPSCPEFKKGALCRLLRHALTGQSTGPKMEDLLPLMAPHAVQSRLGQEA
jgi:glutamyl-tRNA synthetase